VSRDFEVGTNVSCVESTVIPRMGLIFTDGASVVSFDNALTLVVD